MSVIAVIPARYGSSRFPGKPLALIAGKPMIQWVYMQAKQAQVFDAVIVATDDTRIQQAVQDFGGQVRITQADHPSGTDRVWEVAKQFPKARYVFNLQGDEPLMKPLYLEEAVHFLKFHHDHADIMTLKTPIRDPKVIEDPNIVKVVTTDTGKALYFSRAPIPFVRDGIADDVTHYRHIGLYGFQYQALERFVQLPVSGLEHLEKLEQLRALEAGMSIYLHTVQDAPIGVDTPEDLALVNQLATQMPITAMETV